MLKQTLDELIERARAAVIRDSDRRLQSESFARGNVSDGRVAPPKFMRDYRHAWAGRLLPDVRR